MRCVFRSEVQTEFTNDPLPDETQLPIGAQEAIFRVVQEALANVARHARAERVYVHLRRKAQDARQTLQVEVSDDGQGFDMSNVRIGMGLSNMRARIVELGGSFEVQSASEKGTIVTFNLPLQQPRDAFEAAQHAKEDRFQIVYWASMLSSFAVTFVFILVGIFGAFLFSGSGNERNRTILILVLATSTAVTLPLIFASIAYRRRALANDTTGIWQKLLRHYDASQLGSFSLLLAFVALTFRQFAVVVPLLVITIGIIVMQWRTHRQLDQRIGEWATARGLQTRLNEQAVFLGFGAGFIALVFAGIFGDPRQATLFHDTLDDAWLTSVLTLAYPFLLLFSVPAIVLLRNQVKRLKAIEGESFTRIILAAPVTAQELQELKWLRIGATMYIVGCLLAAGSIGPALLGNSRPAAVAMLAVAITMLVLKWRAERMLTLRVNEWSNLSTQNSRQWLYAFFFVTLCISFISGVIGGYFGAASDDANTPPPIGSPIEVLLGLGTAMLMTPLWLGMMVFVTRQRIRLLKNMNVHA